MKPVAVFILFFVVVFAVAGLSSRFTTRDWYWNLNKPSWTPPDWLFGPVWTVLYLMIVVSGWLVWKRAGWKEAAWPLLFYAFQLVLNGLWSWFFFGLQKPLWALADIVVLWAAIVVTAGLFWMVQAWAGALLIPYALWVTFAAILNSAIVRLNR